MNKKISLNWILKNISFEVWKWTLSGSYPNYFEATLNPTNLCKSFKSSGMAVKKIKEKELRAKESRQQNG